MQYLKGDDLELNKYSLVQLQSFTDTQCPVFYTPTQKIVLPHRISWTIKLHSKDEALSRGYHVKKLK